MTINMITTLPMITQGLIPFRKPIGPAGLGAGAGAAVGAADGAVAGATGCEKMGAELVAGALD